MFREVFVPLLGSRSDDAALDAALAIARHQQAHLTALITLQHPMPLVSEFGYAPMEVDQQLLEDARTEASERAERTRVRLARETVPSDVRITKALALWSEEVAAMQALHSDISLIGRPGPGEFEGSPRFQLSFRSMLLRSGRPVVVVPPDTALPIPASRVVLAWKPTPEASRAVHDALPLLAAGAEIDVLVVDPQVTESGYGGQPGADIARLLARHGFKATVVEQPRAGLSIGDCLLRHVREAGAELLVMGGYGHHHWRELMLGGATRTAVERAPTAVLFAH